MAEPQWYRIGVEPCRLMPGYMALVWAGDKIYHIAFHYSRQGAEHKARAYVVQKGGRYSV